MAASEFLYPAKEKSGIWFPRLSVVKESFPSLDFTISGKLFWAVMLILKNKEIHNKENVFLKETIFFK